MIKILMLSSLLMLHGCKNVIEKHPPFVVKDKQPCIDACISKRFHDFHNSGGTFSGSSSMNGLSQTEIWSTIHNYCSEIMNKRHCIYMRGIYTNYDLYTFNYEYGYYTNEESKEDEI